MIRLSIHLDLRRPQRPGRRGAVAAVALAAALVLPAVVVGGHQFTDVPNSHLFHNDIAKAYQARITAGCTATTFCPDAPVTRGQMTAFLNRGLARLSYGSLSGSSAGAVQAIGSVTITAGNVTGGLAHVVITATVDAYVNGAGCPCEATVGIYNGPNQISPLMYMDMVATPTPADGDTDDVATALGVAIVPTGVARTYHVNLQRLVGSGTVNAYGTLIAEVIPFDADGDPPGGAALAPFSTIGKPDER